MDYISLKSRKSKAGKMQTSKRNQNGNYPKNPWFGCDKFIVPRVREYMNAQRGKRIDVEVMGENLQKMYSEYKRKKRGPFLVSVRKAYNFIKENSDDEEKSEIVDVDLDDSPEFSSENENYVEIEDTNFMNKSLQRLYSQQNQQTGGKRKEIENEKSSKSRKRKRNEEMSGEQPKKIAKSAGLMLTEPTASFSDLAGCESTLLELYEILHQVIHPELFQKLHKQPPRGILLHGPPGCGKTMMASAIAGDMGFQFIRITSTELMSGVTGDSEGKIRDLFIKAEACAPCVLFIDNVDAITQKRDTSEKRMDQRIVVQLIACMQELNSKDNKILVLGATNRPDSVDPSLRLAGRFDHELKVSIPNEDGRERILRVLCRELRLDPNVDFKILAKSTPGFVGVDLMALSRTALSLSIKRILKSTTNQFELTEDKIKSDPTIFTKSLQALANQTPLDEEQLNTVYVGMEDFQNALTMVQPSAKREGFATIPDVTWNDIGALDNIRKKIKLATTAPIYHQEALKKLGLSKPNGILLFGPPGCGKTMLAKAVANESGLNFISVKGSELLNMYVGETERAVRQCFERARYAAPCVIFFDEVDAICQARSKQNDSSTHILTTLLTEMDGFDSRKNVIVIGATNRPDLMDPACIRTGRFGKTLYVDLPTPDERCAILKKLTKNGTCPQLSTDVELADLAFDNRCYRFSGADLAKLVFEASESVLEEVVDGVPNTEFCVTRRHFEIAFSKTKSSVSDEDYEMYQQFKISFCGST